MAFDECVPEPRPENERKKFDRELRAAWIEEYKIWPPLQSDLDHFCDLISAHIERIQND